MLSRISRSVTNRIVVVDPLLRQQEHGARSKEQGAHFRQDSGGQAWGLEHGG